MISAIPPIDNRVSVLDGEFWNKVYNIPINPASGKSIKGCKKLRGSATAFCKISTKAS